MATEDPPSFHFTQSAMTVLAGHVMTNTTDLPPTLPCNNPRNVVSPLVAEMVDTVIYVGLFPVFITWGVITNVINMAVFARQGLSDRINVCLFSLAVSDTGFLLFLMAGKSYALLSLLDARMGNYWQRMHYGVVLASSLGFLAISNIVTAIIALERCLCVLSPLKAARLFRTRTMGVLIVAVSLYILMVLNAALSVKYRTVTVTDPLSNTTTFISRLSAFYLRHRTFIDVIYNHMLLVTLPFLSLVVVVVCTVVIIIRLKVIAAWRRHSVSNMTSLEKHDVSMTRMLMTVCGVYVTCTTPTVTRAVVVFSRVPGFLITGHLCNIFKISIACSHLLEVINTSANFLIYVRQSSRYRDTLRRLCPLCTSGLKHTVGTT